MKTILTCPDDFVTTEMKSEQVLFIWLCVLCVVPAGCQVACQYGTEFQGQCECWRGYKGADCSVYDSTIMTNLDSPSGMNLGGLTYYSPQWTFVDIMHSSMWWVTQRTSGPDEGVWDTREHHLIPWREDGYPQYLPESNMRLLTLLLRDSQHTGPIGTYIVLYEGQGSIQFGFEATEISREPGRIEIEVILDGNSGIKMELENISQSDPIRNVRIIMPGFEDRYDQFPYHPLLLEFLRRFAVIRYMDWGLTNNHPENITWADRRQTTFYTQADGPERRGVAYEHMIALSNIAGASPWICVPHAADDNYIRSLATLIHQNLRPDLRVYVEYSNEVWNSLFTQHAYAGQKGIDLGFADPDKPWEGAWKYTAHRSVQIFDIFKEVFGPEERHRLELILPTQKANPYVTEQIVSFQEAYRHADTIALTAYFCGYLGSESMLDWVRQATIDQLFDNCTASFVEEQQILQSQIDVAATYNLSLLTYEAGQHIVVSSNLGGGPDDEEITDKFIEMNRSPRMESVKKEWLDMYDRTVVQDVINQNNTGGLWTQFLSIEEYGRYGSWGILEHMLQDTYSAPKYLALQTYMNRYIRNLEGQRCSFIETDVVSYGCYKGTSQTYGCYQTLDSGTTWQALPGLPSDITYQYTQLDALVTPDSVLYIRTVDHLGVSSYLALPSQANQWTRVTGDIYYSDIFNGMAMYAMPPGEYGGLNVEGLNCP